MRDKLVKNLIIFSIIGLVGITGLIVTANGFLVEQEITGHWYISEDGVTQVWIWNPNNYNITHVNDKEFTITHIGNWDVINESENWRLDDYHVNGQEVYLESSEWLSPIVWLDEQVSKLWKHTNLHEFQIKYLMDTNAKHWDKIVELQETVKQQNEKLANQAKKIKELEQKTNFPI